MGGHVSSQRPCSKPLADQFLKSFVDPFPPRLWREISSPPWLPFGLPGLPPPPPGPGEDVGSELAQMELLGMSGIPANCS